jgi:predicted nucleic acid-binding protein
MPNTICVDFDMMLYYLVGDKSHVDKINMYIKTEEMAITAITLADLAISIEDDDIPRKISANFRILPFDERAALKAREIYLLMQEAGNEKVKIAYNSAIAITNDTFMLVKDKNRYKGVPGLKFI